MKLNSSTEAVGAGIFFFCHDYKATYEGYSLTKQLDNNCSAFKTNHVK